MPPLFIRSVEPRTKGVAVSEVAVAARREGGKEGESPDEELGIAVPAENIG